MFRRLRDLLTGEQPVPEDYSDEDRVQLAVCVLLLEVARADEHFSDTERGQVIEILADKFEIDEDEAHDLIDASTADRGDRLDLFNYTREINASCTPAEKEAIVESIWRVIYADGRLDSHEDHLAHRLATLLNLNHRQLINAKLRVLEQLRGGGASAG
jgi:uncharacterized tellurite resistance protein B-like protein